MAGVIDFSMEMDAGRATAGINSANVALNNMGRTLAGLIVPMNAVNLAQGPAASFWIQGNQMLPGLAAKFDALRGKTSRAAGGMHELAAGTKATQVSLRAMETTLAMFGGQVAPQLSAGILTVTTSLNAMRAAAAATGLSLGAIGGSAIIALASVAAVSTSIGKYIEMRDAQTEAENSAGNRESSIKSKTEEYKKMLAMAVTFERISKEEAARWMVGFDIPGESLDVQHNRNLGLGKRLRESGMMPPSQAETNALEIYLTMLRKNRAENTSEKAAAREQIYQETSKALKDAFDVSKAARQDPEKLRQAIMANRDRKLGELDKEDKAKDKEGGMQRPTASLTSWEKIGAVFRNGSGGLDPNRETAINTRLMHNELKITNRLLGEKGTSAVLRE